MAARVHGGLHPWRVHEEATLSIPPWHHPRRTCLARVDLHEVGDLLDRTNSLVQLHNLDGGSQVTPNQSRRHHSPKGNTWCVDNELLALVLQMIISPTLISLSLMGLDLVERWFEWKATWGRLEIKIYVVGMEYLDLNTSVGGSPSENVCWKCRHVLMALSTNEEWVEGYI